MKRNSLIKQATHDILINMDDDDIYLPSYVDYTTTMLIETFKKGIGLVGSNQMLFIYPNDNYKISGINCGALRQIHEGTMCYHKKYIKAMGGYQRNSKGEGARLIDGNEKLCMNLDIYKQMICVGHGNNTVDKEQFKHKQLPMNLIDDIQLLPQFEILQFIFKNHFRDDKG